MDGNESPTIWQDWALVGLRVLLLVFAGLVLFTAQTPGGLPLYATNEIAVALVIGTVSTIIIVLPILFHAAAPALPVIVMVGDWAMAGLLTYIIRGSSPLLIVFGSLIVVISVLRLGAIWGAVDAAGVLIAIVVSLGSIRGFEQFDLLMAESGPSLLIIGALAVVAVIWGGVLQHEIKRQRALIDDAEESKEREVAEMRERTRSIYEMAAILSSTLNYEKILHAAINAGRLALRELEGEGRERLISVVMLFQSREDTLRIITSRGITRNDESRTTPGKEGIIGEALKECVPIFGGIARKDPELQYFAGFQNVRSMLCIPLRAGFDNYGVLLYGSEQANAFSDEHTELLTSIGTQATMALQNAVLYQNLLDERDRIVEVEEEARKKLARDLHDGPTQNVAAIAMRMGIIYRMLEKTPDEVPGELKKIEDIARRTTKEIRHMLFTLRPLALENQGLTTALNQLAEKMKETHDQNVVIRVARDAEKALDSHQQGTIFYIIEEAVGNARKHAQASQISVAVHRQQEDLVVVNISDNGVGFDTSAVDANYDKRGSLGMVNLRERTELLGGTLRIDSTPGRGTSVTVLVPIKEQPSKDRMQARRVASTGSSTKLAAAALERIRASQSND